MKKNTSTVTVVMPVFNVAPYVERCILSVMQQTYPATECIIVDDGSTDDSINRCIKLIDGYKGSTRFCVLYHGRNRGLSAARNTGTNAATSTYIFYLDSDDEMTADCLEKLVAPMINDESIEMVMGAYKVDKPISVLGRRFILYRNCFLDNKTIELKSNEDIYKWYYHGIKPLNVWNKLLKLSFVKEHHLYNKENLLHEDCIWTFYLMRCLSHVVYISDITYFYHRRHQSIRSGTDKEKKLIHFGNIFNDITNQMMPGERINETRRWAFLFGNYYIDASENPEYKNYYDAYCRELLNGHQILAYYRLKIINFLSKSLVGRMAFKAFMKLRYVVLLIIK